MSGNVQIEIRNTTLADIAKLRAMHGQSWRDTYSSPENGVTKEWIEEHTASWLTPEKLAESEDYFKTVFDNPDHLHQIAINGAGEVIGLVHMTNEGAIQHLGAVYVAKPYIGTGLAQQLMERALDWGGTTKKTYLEVATYNERAKAFYRKYHFVEKPDSETLFADTIPIITMERE